MQDRETETGVRLTYAQGQGQASARPTTMVQLRFGLCHVEVGFLFLLAMLFVLFLFSFLC
jgi:hypothetical protein